MNKPHNPMEIGRAHSLAFMPWLKALRIITAFFTCGHKSCQIKYVYVSRLIHGRLKTRIQASWFTGKHFSHGYWFHLHTRHAPLISSQMLRPANNFQNPSRPSLLTGGGGDHQCCMISGTPNISIHPLPSSTCLANTQDSLDKNWFVLFHN